VVRGLGRGLCPIPEKLVNFDLRDWPFYTQKRMISLPLPPMTDAVVSSSLTRIDDITSRLQSVTVSISVISWLHAALQYAAALQLNVVELLSL